VEASRPRGAVPDRQIRSAFLWGTFWALKLLICVPSGWAIFVSFGTIRAHGGEMIARLCKGLQRPIGSAFSSRLAKRGHWMASIRIGLIDHAVNEPSAAVSAHDDVKYSKCAGRNPIVESHRRHLFNLNVDLHEMCKELIKRRWLCQSL
jgi:hypothetical protein